MSRSLVAERAGGSDWLAGKLARQPRGSLLISDSHTVITSQPAELEFNPIEFGLKVTVAAKLALRFDLNLNSDELLVLTIPIKHQHHHHLFVCVIMRAIIAGSWWPFTHPKVTSSRGQRCPWACCATRADHDNDRSNRQPSGHLHHHHRNRRRRSPTHHALACRLMMIAI